MFAKSCGMHASSSSSQSGQARTDLKSIVQQDKLLSYPSVLLKRVVSFSFTDAVYF